MTRLVAVLLTFAFAPALLAVTWPIGISSNGRYFVDAAGIPFLMSFDADHTLLGAICNPANPGCSATNNWNTYLSSRQSYQFNGVQIFGSTLHVNSSGALADGRTPFNAGSAPSNYSFFTSGGVSTLNPDYWSEVLAFVNSAASYGLMVALNPLPAQYYDCNNGGSPCEMPGSGPAFANNGAAAVYSIGAQLGTIFSNSPNLIWYIGDDCNWCNATLENQFIQGILSTDPNHLVTFEGNYFRSYSNQYNNAYFSPAIKTDLVYSYYETYDEALQAYASSPVLPCFLGEANYEGGNHYGLSKGANQFILRMQNWWTVLSGCPGYIWGNQSVNTNDSGYPASLTTLATSEVQYLPALLSRYAWWNLIPDTGHTVVSSGYGTYSNSNTNLYNASYAATAWVQDGSLAIAYTPVATTLTVDMTAFAGPPVAARWYDPSNGTCMAPAGSPFGASGTTTPVTPSTATQEFTTPGLNQDGDTDWVLLLDASPSGPPVLTCLNQTSGAVGSTITILGNNFGAVQGASSVSFNGITATPANWSPTSITVPVPAGATSGPIVLTAGGVASNGIQFTVIPTSTVIAPQNPLPPSQPISLVQHTSMDSGSTSSTTLSFNSPNGTGNWIAVVIRAGNFSTELFTVSDSNGNTYRQAVQLGQTISLETMAIFYAENIRGGANTITVSDTIPSPLRVAILEYSGVATSNSLDVTSMQMGHGASPDSGSVAATANGDLLLGAVLTSNSGRYTAGVGYYMEESVPKQPLSKLMVEDQIQNAAGIVSANASLAAPDDWGAVLAAFKPAQ